MAVWVNGYSWTIWLTGTFRPEMRYRDTINTKRAFVRYINFLSEKYGKHSIQYFMAVERFKSGFDTHVHALLMGVDGLRYREIGEAWRGMYGREQVEGYDKKLGADYYITKYVTKSLCDWDFLIKK